MSDAAVLQAELAKYVAARDRILDGAQSYELDGVQYTRATFFRLEDKIEELRASLALLRVGGVRVLRTRGGRA